MFFFYLLARSVRTVWLKLDTPMLITFKPTALFTAWCCLVPVLYKVTRNLKKIKLKWNHLNAKTIDENLSVYLNKFKQISVETAISLNK
jgi:hypothetical protein